MIFSGQSDYGLRFKDIFRFTLAVFSKEECRHFPICAIVAILSFLNFSLSGFADINFAKKVNLTIYVKRTCMNLLYAQLVTVKPNSRGLIWLNWPPHKAAVTHLVISE